MSKAQNYQKPSAATQEAALKLAKANQRPGQTKEQTQLVAQGIQKGIEQYKKQQKAKARELDKALKKVRHAAQAPTAFGEAEDESMPETLLIYKQSKLAWSLLLLSWLLFAALRFSQT